MDWHLKNLIAQFYFSLLSETHRGRQTHSFGVGNHEKGKAREGVWGSRETNRFFNCTIYLGCILERSKL